MSGESNPPVLGNVPPNPIAAAKANRTNRLPTPAQEAQQRLERGAMVTEKPDAGPWTSTFKGIERWTHLSTGEFVFKMYAGVAGKFPMEFKYTDAVLEAALANEPDDIQTQARSGQYKPDIDWQVKWKRVNGWPTAIEVTRMNNQQTMDIPDTGKATTKPVTGDKPAVKVPHWTGDTKRLGRFMASWNNLAEARGITTEAERDEIRKRVQKSEHIHDTRYLDHALLKALREELDRLKPDTAPWGADDEQVLAFHAFFAEIGKVLGLSPLALQTRVQVEVFKLFKTQDLADLNIAREIVQERVMAELQKALPTKPVDPAQSDKLEEVFERKPGEKPADATSTPIKPQNGQEAKTGIVGQENANKPAAGLPDATTGTPKSEPAKAIKPDTETVALVTVVDNQTGEIIAFDPNRAIALAKGKSALVNRLVEDKVLVKDVDYGKVPGTDKNTLFKPGAEKLLTAFQLFDAFKAVEVVRDWKEGFFFYEYECTLYDRETGKAIGSGIGSCNSMEKKYRFRWVTKDRVPGNLKIDTLPQRGSKISEFDFAVEKAETTGQYGKSAEHWKLFQDAIANGSATSEEVTYKSGKKGKKWIIDGTLYGVPNDDIFDLVNTISKMAQKRALVAAALNATGASAVFTQDLEDFTDFGMIEAA